MTDHRQSSLALVLVFLYCFAGLVFCSAPAEVGAEGSSHALLVPDDLRLPGVGEALLARAAAIATVYAEPPQVPAQLDVLPRPLPTSEPTPAPRVAMRTASFEPCPGIACYRIDIMRTIGDTSLQVDVDTLVFDLAAGRILSLADILLPSPVSLEAVSAIALAQLTEALSGEDEAAHALAARATAPCLGNFARFVLAGDAIVFFFPPATLGGDSVEVKEVRIPYLDLLPHLNIKVGYARAGDAASCLYIETVPPAGAAPIHDGAPALRIALTFDDGPHPAHTALILQELSKRRAVGTFFVIGSRAKDHPDLLRQIVLQGSEIGNHTWTHSDLTRLSPEQITAEIERTQALIEQVTGRRPALMRPPGGFYNRQVIEAAGLPLVMWSIDPQDWRGGDAGSVAQFIVDHAHDGGIVLQHDPRISSYESLGQVLDVLSERGYRFVTVSELLGLEGRTATQGEVWHRLK